jgi:hypothetical protein
LFSHQISGIFTVHFLRNIGTHPYPSLQREGIVSTMTKNEDMLSKHIICDIITNNPFSYQEKGMG